MIPRAAFDVFRRLSDDSYVEHAVSASSFLEIYNEEMCDLLLDCDLDDVATVKARSKGFASWRTRPRRRDAASSS